MTASPPSGSAQPEETFTLRVVESIGEISPQAWDDLAEAAEPAGGPGPRGNPFLRHAFLQALEESGSVSLDAGWIARFMLLEDSGGRLVAAVPAYLKTNSQGEYVFDHGWANAFQRAGGRYYPKLQISVPFTPATGPRFLAPATDAGALFRRALCEGIETFTERLGLSSAHATFLTDQDLKAAEETGWLHRTDQQFHFFNRGYDSYDDFLQTLASRKRKALRKERARALEDGISIEWLSGSDLTEAVWDAFFEFYIDTGSRKWGQPYLNRRFFSLIGERMPERIALVLAKRAGRYIAGALNFVGDSAIYGRNWGCIEDHPFLHFEVCYHQAIDYAIAHGLGRVEAGAQGQHKLARGYEPVTTHSAHHIVHPGLREAVAAHLENERQEVGQISEILGAHTPYRKGSA